MKKKNVTLEDLASTVDILATRMTKMAASMEDLAGMGKEGFDAVDKRFERVERRLESVENRLIALENGQEDMNLRLGQYAPNVDKQERKKKMALLKLRCAKVFAYLLILKPYGQEKYPPERGSYPGKTRDHDSERICENV